MMVSALATMIALSVRYGGEGSEENNYTPGDTRLHTISTFFCSSVQIKMTADSSQMGHVNLYLLNEKPSLTARDSFSISQSFTLSEYHYEYWQFYLYPNSNFSVNACVTSGSSSYYFYVIKGSNDFNHWIDKISSSYYEQELYVSTPCGGNSTLSYTTKKEDYYYFAYYCDSSNCDGQLEIFLQRFEYTVGSSTDSADNCTTTVTSGPCSLAVAYQSDYNQALVAIEETPPNGNWEQQFTVEFNCGARAEAYLAVVLPPVLLVLIIIVGIVLGCYLYIRLKRRPYKPIVEPTTASAPPFADPPPEPGKVSYTAIVEAEPPPPYNPQQQPQPYQ